ncbi:MAG: zinc transport system ATP-binding protein, partial [Porticoccus sp.]
MKSRLIELNAIGHAFRGNRVLSDVSLTIETGQIITLIGPNGAGKTTLVKIVLSLLKPDIGTVTRAPDLRVGYMPQKLHIDPTLPITLRRFLSLAEPNLQLCLNALAEVGIEKLIEMPLQSLSGGEMQRALLARAILRKPNLLVLDEPVQ